MRQRQTFLQTRFPSKVLAVAHRLLEELAVDEDKSTMWGAQNKLNRGGESWEFDSDTEWFAEFDRGSDYAWAFLPASWKHTITYSQSETKAEVEIECPTRTGLLSVLQVFVDAAETYRLPVPEQPAVYDQGAATGIASGHGQNPDWRTFKEQPAVHDQRATPLIAIGHGQNPDWRILKDDLTNIHCYEVHAYETGPRGGMTISEVLGELAAKTNFAVLVWTAEDLAADGLSWARQNVIHETGFFHGRHGFRRTAVVVEEGTNLPSNFDGLQQLRYDSGQVLSAVSGIIGMIRREFPPED